MSEQNEVAIFTEFQAACKDGKQVHVSKGALETAKADFNLNTMADAIFFYREWSRETSIY